MLGPMLQSVKRGVVEEGREGGREGGWERGEKETRRKQLCVEVD